MSIFESLSNANISWKNVSRLVFLVISPVQQATMD